MPIPFSGAMVRGLLADAKTQTRRLVRLEPWIARLGGDLERAWPDKAFGVTPCLQVPCADGTVQRMRNPWGWPEPFPVRLWVREAWRTARSLDENNAGQMAEMAREAGYDNSWAPLEFMADGERRDWSSIDEPGRKRLARFMPRWASRITLEVTGVRVERLQDISEEDARAEGYIADLAPFNPRLWYAHLWDAINGDRAPWASNPWVWVVEFRRLP